MDGIGQFAARELINDGWSVLAVCLVVIFGAFLIPRLRMKDWYWDHTNQAAIALLVYFTGEAIARGWTVLLLWHYRHHWNAIDIENKYPLALIGAAISMTGALCCIRIFAPDRIRRWAWIASGVAAIVFAVAIAQS